MSGPGRGAAGKKERFVYLWEYRVKESLREDFLRHHGPRGPWVALFRKGEGYLGTELLQDLENPERFLTLDTWRSRADRHAWRRKHAREFRRLDRVGEVFTRSERFLGDFSRPGDPGRRQPRGSAARAARTPGQ